MARLIIFDERVRAIDLPNRPVVIGRSLKSDIPIRDRLLSRRHCQISPRSGSSTGAAARSEAVFSDLRSQNGSFLNGVRVDEAKLEFDDVIEIGSTVMVFLDTETWERGEGLTKLRNPVKAQELVQRLRRIARSENGGDAGGVERATGAVATEAVEAEFAQWATGQLRKSPFLEELIAGYVSQRVVAIFLRRLPELRRAISEAIDRVMLPESFEGDAESFRAVVADAVRGALREVVGDAESGTRDDRPSAARAGGGEKSDPQTPTEGEEGARE